MPRRWSGILLETANDRAGARAQYEAVLAKSPRAGVAANNLAWMLAEDGRHDEALRWATVAVERAAATVPSRTIRSVGFV